VGWRTVSVIGWVGCEQEKCGGAWVGEEVGERGGGGEGGRGEEVEGGGGGGVEGGGKYPRSNTRRRHEYRLMTVVQWLRARFNECYEKAEFAKSKCAEELPFVDRLLHDKARETVSCDIIYARATPPRQDSADKKEKRAREPS